MTTPNTQQPSQLKTGPELRTHIRQPGLFVHFLLAQYNIEPLVFLEKQIITALAASNAGTYDGTEVSADHRFGSLSMSGDDTDKLLKVVEPILTANALMSNAKLIQRRVENDKVRETISTIIVKDVNPTSPIGPSADAASDSHD